MRAGILMAELNTCDWLGLKGVCGKPSLKSFPTRCSAHKAKDQMRYCARDGCKVRVADIEGQQCYKHKNAKTTAEKPREPAEVKTIKIVKKPAAKARKDNVLSKSTADLRALKKQLAAISISSSTSSESTGDSSSSE